MSSAGFEPLVGFVVQYIPKYNCVQCLIWLLSVVVLCVAVQLLLLLLLLLFSLRIKSFTTSENTSTCT